MTRNWLKEIDTHQISVISANLSIGAPSPGGDKTEPFATMNGTHTTTDNTTTAASDTDDSDSNGGVSILGLLNDSSLAAKGQIASVDDATLKAAEQEMSASARSMSISAGADETIPITNGGSHGA